MTRVTISTLHEFITLFNAQRERDRDSLIAQVTTVPVSDAVVERIARLGHEDLRIVLRNHPGDSIERRYESVRTMHSIFHRAQADLLAQLDLFHERSSKPNYRKRSERHVDDTIKATVSKEIMAFSSAAASLEELTRKLNKALAVPHYTEKMAEIFDPCEHEFVTELRNAMAHYLAPDASAIIRWDVKGRSTDFYLDTWELQTYNNFNSRARTYLQGAPRHVLVRPLVTSYSERMNKFLGWLTSTIDADPPVAMADYRRCRRAARANSARLSYKLLLDLAVQSRVDPYTKLDFYLTPEQLERVSHLPARSKEQVDFIIACVDEQRVCDDEIRALAYRLFGVEAT